MRILVGFTVLLMIGAATAHSPGPAASPIEPGDADLAAYIGVTDEMHTRWHALDAVCDPDAVFALLYLITTSEVGELVNAAHFEDNPFVVEWDLDFASRYFAAYDAYHAGDPVPEPWQKAFDNAAGGHSMVIEDMLIGMSAHVNYDLAHSTYAMGLPQDGRRDDYDRVNDAFADVIVPASDEMGARYDPTLARDGNGSTPLDDGVLALLISWRDNAWVNAQLLADAEGDAIATAIVEAKILSEANAVADSLTIDHGDTTADRIAYCEASGHPALSEDHGGPGYGDDWVEQEGPVADFLICHKPGTKAEKTMSVNDHAWQGHNNHGDTPGACP